MELQFGGTNFTGATNVDLDPQLVRNKDIHCCILQGINFEGKSFDDVCLTFTKFIGATNVNLDPQTVLDKDIHGCDLYGINFEGKSFDDVIVEDTDFRGAINANLKGAKNSDEAKGIDKILYTKEYKLLDETEKLEEKIVRITNEINELKETFKIELKK